MDYAEAEKMVAPFHVDVAPTLGQHRIERLKFYTDGHAVDEAGEQAYVWRARVHPACLGLGGLFHSSSEDEYALLVKAVRLQTTSITSLCDQMQRLVRRRQRLQATFDEGKAELLALMQPLARITTSRGCHEFDLTVGPDGTPQVREQIAQAIEADQHPEIARKLLCGYALDRDKHYRRWYRGLATWLTWRVQIEMVRREIQPPAFLRIGPHRLFIWPSERRYMPPEIRIVPPDWNLPEVVLEAPCPT